MISVLDSLFSVLVQHLLFPSIRSLGLAVIVALALTLFRIKCPALRFPIWTCVLYFALGMPLLSQLLPPVPLPVKISSEPLFAQTALKSQFNLFTDRLPTKLFDDNTRQAVSKAHSLTLSWSAVTAATYLLVTLFFLARLGLGWLISQKLRRRARAITDPHILDELTIRVKAAKLVRLPTLCESDTVVVPVTLGSIRPLILLPADWRDWEEAKLGAVLEHELAHVAQRDYTRQMIASVHCSIFWFSPLSWWLKYHLEELAEQVGDDSALLTVADRIYYAEVLLGFFVAMQGMRRRISLPGISMARCGRATRRVDRILASRAVLSPRLKRSAIAGLILFVTPLIYLMAAIRPPIIPKPVLFSPVIAQPVSNPSREEPEKKDIAVLSKRDQSVGTSTIASSTPNRTQERRSVAEQPHISGGGGIIRTIKIIGSTSFPAAVLQSKFKLVQIGQSVTPETVESEIGMYLLSFLMEHGLLQAEVKGSFVPLKGRDVELHLQITEGPQYRLSDLAIRGFTAFSHEDIYSQFNLHVGDVANINGLKSAMERIRNMYADRGYIKMSYIPERNFDLQKQTVAITLTFEEGMQYHVAYVGFVGFSDQTQENQLRALVDIYPGDIYSASKEKAVFAELKKVGVTKDTIEIIDESRGLIAIAFWLQSPQ